MRQGFKNFSVALLFLNIFALAAISPAWSATRGSTCSRALRDSNGPFEVVRELRCTSHEAADALLDAIEDKLQNAKILDVENLGGGVHKSYKVKIGHHLYAVFKPDSGGTLRKPQREVAAYRVSKRFKLDLVPPTVIRKVKGKVGSFQLFVRGSKTLRASPGYKWDKKRSGKRLKVFDWLMNNHDRGSNHGNYLISGVDGEIIGIDHGLGFSRNSRKPRSDKVPRYSRSDIKDSEFYRLLSAPSDEELKDDMKGLSSVRKREFLERRQKLLRRMKSRNS